MTTSFLHDIDGPKSKRLLLEAGLASVAVLGIDQCTASDVIERAGVSRPTFYSYFDDVPGLLADCWIFGGSTWFETLMWEHLPDGFERSDEHTAYVEMLMAASRTPELADVVFPDIAANWKKLSKRSESEQVRRTWVLATRLGMTASEPVMPSVTTLDKFVTGLELIPDDFVPPQEDIDLLRAVEPVVNEPTITHADDITERLVTAVVRVVASSGVARASMTRVCRAARVTTGSAKPRFANIADLMARGFEHAVMEVTQENVSQAPNVFGGVSPIHAYARLVVSSLHPTRKSWRRYRQEMHLAARKNDAIRQQMSDSRQRVDEVLASSLWSSNVPEPIVDISIKVNQVQSIGFSLLDDLGMPVRGVNHAVIPAMITVDSLASLV